jgi:hypothetical protein
MYFEMAMAAVSIISGIVGAQGAQAAGAAQAREARRNAAYLREQADFARFMAQLDIEAADIEHQRFRGAQESIFAAAGVSLSGSVMAALGESEKSQEQNHFRRLVASENDAQYMINRADMNDRLATNVTNAASTKAFSSILGGVANAGMWAYRGGMFSPTSTPSAVGGVGTANSPYSETLPLAIGQGMGFLNRRGVGTLSMPPVSIPGPMNPYPYRRRRIQ